MSSDKFQLVIQPVSPATCRSCGVAFGVRPFVDTALNADFCNLPHWNDDDQEYDHTVNVDMAGAVYFCESCVVNMGMLFDMLPSFKVNEMVAKIEHQQQVIIEKAHKIVALEKILDGYRDLGSTDLISSGESAAYSSADEKAEGDFSAESSDGTDFGISETDESVSNPESASELSRSLSDESGNSGDESIKTSPGPLGF